MANTDFFHGVEAFLTQVNGQTIRAIRSSVIGMVVSCGMGPVNVPTLINGSKNAATAKFGAFHDDGFSGPLSLDQAFNQAPTLAVVVNVCDPAVHNSTITNEIVSLNRVNGIGKTAKPYHTAMTLNSTVSAPIVIGGGATWAVPTGATVTGLKDAKGGNVIATGNADGQWSVTGSTLTIHGAGAPATYGGQTLWVTYTATLVLGTDYTYTASTGSFKRVYASTLLLAGADLKITTYTYVDPTKVDATAIIGGIDGSAYTGISALVASASYPGVLVAPKLLIAPFFSDTLGVANALNVSSRSLNARAIVDQDDTTENAIIYAGNFGGDVDRVSVHYPNHYTTNPDDGTDNNFLVPASIHLAGLQARVDKDLGKGSPFVSLSNKEIVGMTGLTKPVDFTVTNLNETGGESTQQTLNANNVMTTIYNQGWRAYGNTQANGDFLCVARMADMTIEAMAQGLVFAVDQPLNSTAFLDLILTVGRHFLRALEAKGALVPNPDPDTDSDVWFDPDLNTSDQLALGHASLTFRLNPPPPLQRLTVIGQLTSDFVKSLFTTLNNG